MTQEQCDKVRKKWHIEVEGDDVPAPIKRFVDMRFPQPLEAQRDRERARELVP